MKILLVVDCPLSFINGVTSSVLNLAEGLRKLGHDVRTLASSEAGPESFTPNAYSARSISMSHFYTGLRFSPYLSRKLYRQIVAWKPDIVHTNTEAPLSQAARRICHNTGAKHIASFHTNYMGYYTCYFPFPEKVDRYLYQLYARRFLSSFDAAIFPSAWGSELNEQVHADVPRYIVPNGIHTEVLGIAVPGARDKIRSQWHIPQDAKLLIFVGRVAAEKNIPELLQLFDKLPDSNLRLMITGGGPALEELQAEAARLSAAPRITFTGMVPTDQVHEYYSAADVFVTASRSEVQPLTYVEAMASGLPVVCADAPYIQGLVLDEETGYAYKSPEEFACGVQKLASDEAFRKVLGANAREKVLHDYSIETFANTCLGIYEKALANKKSNPQH